MPNRFYRLKILAIFMISSILLIGCSNKNDNTLTNVALTEKEKVIASFSGDMFSVLKINFNREIGGMALYLEEWKDGEKINVSTLSYGGTTKENELYISSDISVDSNSKWNGTEWKLITKYQGARATSDVQTFQFGDGITAVGSSYSILGENQKTKIKLDPVEKYVLAARFFDLSGMGLKSVTCESLNENEELLKEFDYVVLLKLDLYRTEEEAERLNE